MRKVVDLIRTLMIIDRLEIDHRLKKRVRKTWLAVFFFKRYDAKNNRADIVGFDVGFLDYEALRHLYDELFLGSEYQFNADTDHPHIIDCGSNIGLSVLYFKMLYPKSRILAFEPGSETFSRLRENVRNNGLSSVELHQVALSSKEGPIDFYHDPDNPGSLRMSTVRQRLPKNRRTVEASLLSKYIVEEVDFLKLDIEGAELEVVEELNNAGRLNHVKQMAIEYHHHISREHDDLARMLGILEGAGFGYQIESRLARPLSPEQFQDICIYAYRKKSTS